MPRTRRQQQEEDQPDPPEALDVAEGIGAAAAAAAATSQAAGDAQPLRADGTAEAGPSPQVDDFSKWPALLSSLTALQQRVANPAVLLQPNPEVTAAARSTIKELHAYATAAASASSTSGFASAVPAGDARRQLHVAPEFDAEQVWLQLELLLAPLLRQCRRAVTQLQQEPPDRLVPPDVDADVDKLLHGHTEQQLDEDEEEDGDEEDEDEEEEEEGGSLEEEDDEQQQKRKQKQPGEKKAKRLATEDRFFKLSDMEAFVAQAEREAAGLEDADEDEEEDYEEEEEEYASDLEDSEEEGGRGKRRRGLPAADDDGIDDEDERRLAALLDDAAALAGQKRGQQQQQQGAAKRRKQQQVQGSDSESGEGEDAVEEELMYQDFFGDEEEDEEDSLGEEGVQDEEEEEEPGSSDGEEQLQQQARKHKQKLKAAAAGGAGQQRGLYPPPPDVEEEEEGGQEGQLSTHEKQLLRMQERIRELEEENFGDKPWHLLGEVPASRRPLNSALELDMDFETTARPPPAPTEEATASLEEVIKARIREQRWDDVVRVVAPPMQQKKKVLELDDAKAAQGLAEVYEAEYVRAAAEAGGASGGASGLPDKQEPLRRELRALWGALAAKLDALSAFHYAPKPLVEELEVRSEVPALVMEEVAPLAVSTATLQTPAEAYTPQAHGEAKAEQELSREDRKRRRSAKKRVHKAKEAAAEAAAAQKAAAAGGAAAVAGRKSLKAAMAAAKSSGLINADIRPGQKHGKSEFGKSTAAFARIQETRDAAASGKKVKKPAKEVAGTSGSALKL